MNKFSSRVLCVSPSLLCMKVYRYSRQSKLVFDLTSKLSSGQLMVFVVDPITTLKDVSNGEVPSGVLRMDSSHAGSCIL